MDVHRFQTPGNDYDSLSFRDLLDARDAYHVHLMNLPHVIATAIGKYRIRVDDSWPDAEGQVKHKATGPRTLGNSEVRPYSWPAILAFVDQWSDPGSFAEGGTYFPDQIVPRTLYLPDGRKVPVCVVLVDKQQMSPSIAPGVRFPLNNIGGGMPIIADVQGREHIATIACLVSDGHRTYALTNRHVAGDRGEQLFSELNGKKVPIGRSSGKQLTRLSFSEVYPEWAGKKTYLNLDAGLIDITDLNQWTAKIREVGTLGPLADLSSANLSLSLVGCRVVGVGAASGKMEGEISALMYRYKSVGGFEYLADFMIGPRGKKETTSASKRIKSAPEPLTRPGDSGAPWMFDPIGLGESSTHHGLAETSYRPFGIQWGAQVFDEGTATSYALVTSLSTVCRLLDVDVVRDWNLDQTDTWGSIGHFSIAFSVVGRLTDPRLITLMTENAEIISPTKSDILSSEFKGMGSDDFVPLADVPDMFWKPRISKQGFARAMEGPNHFADMDQVRPSDGETLLHLTLDDEFIDPDKWNEFYGSVENILDGSKIALEHRGLLPFRVWQIFNEMVRYVKAGKVAEFVCAAGALTHYLGDACQPLHISYLHDGDPESPETQTINHRDGTTETKTVAGGTGVHSAYEDAMVNAHRDKILEGLDKTPKVKKSELITTGFEAAKRTIEMMRGVFERLPPRGIVDFYVNSTAKPKQLAEDMWDEFGPATIECMQDGVHLLAVLWQSAWVLGEADKNISDPALKALTEQKAMKICQDSKFLPSMPINKIRSVLK